MNSYFRNLRDNFYDRRIWEITLALVIGLLLGALVMYSPYLPISSDFQKLVIVIPFAFTVAILFNNLNKLVLFTLAIGVPLNFDISLIISPYARNPDNIARGYRTLITLTELRISLITIILLIGYAVWLFAPRENRNPVRFFAASTIPALGFIFISILSVTQAQDKQLSLFRIVQLVEVFLVYFYLANHLRTIRQFQFFVAVLFGGMLAESVLMIVQWITGLTFGIAGIEAMSQGPGRIGGTIGNPGPAAGYLSALGVIACIMIWGFSRKSQKVFSAATMMLGTIALISTGSRIGWIGFGVTLAAFIVGGFIYGWVKREGLVVLSILILIIGAPFFSQFYTRFTADDNGSTASRYMMWKLAWNVIRANPFLGVGAGNYALVTRDYFSPDIGKATAVLDIQVHNAYLDVWADSGTFALISYLAMFFIAILKAWSCVKSRSRFVSLMGMGLSLALVSLCIQMVTGTFHMRPITYFTWMLLGMVAGLVGIHQDLDLQHNHLIMNQ